MTSLSRYAHQTHTEQYSGAGLRNDWRFDIDIEVQHMNEVCRIPDTRCPDVELEIPRSTDLKTAQSDFAETGAAKAGKDRCLGECGRADNAGRGKERRSSCACRVFVIGRK